MGNVGVLRAEQREGIHRDHPSRARAWYQHARHRDMYGPFKNEELVGKAIKGKRDRVIIATKVRQRARSERSEQARVSMDAPSTSARRVKDRSEIGRRHNRPLLSASGGQGHAHRGNRGKRWPSWFVKEKCATSDYPKRRSPRFGGHTRSTRSARYKPSIHSGHAIRRMGLLDALRLLDVASSHTVPSAADFLLDRSRKSMIWHQDDFRKAEPALSGRELQTTISSWSRESRKSQGAQVHAGASSRWLGAGTG